MGHTQDLAEAKDSSGTPAEAAKGQGDPAGPPPQQKPLFRAVEMMTSKLPPQSAMALAELAKDLSQMSGGVPVGTACSGCDALFVVLDSLRQVVRELFGVDVGFRHSFACESDVATQAFLRGQFGQFGLSTPNNIIGVFSLTHGQTCYRAVGSLAHRNSP